LVSVRLAFNVKYDGSGINTRDLTKTTIYIENQPTPYPRKNEGYIPFEAKSFKNGKSIGIVKSD